MKNFAKIINGKITEIIIANDDATEFPGYERVPNQARVGDVLLNGSWVRDPADAPPAPTIEQLRDRAMEELRRKRDAVIADADGGELFLRYLIEDAAGRQQMQNQALALKTRFVTARNSIQLATTKQELFSILNNF